MPKTYYKLKDAQGTKDKTNYIIGLREYLLSMKDDIEKGIYEIELIDKENSEFNLNH